jgi:radical SAM family uncharacterized protein
MTPEHIRAAVERHLLKVEKPGRYVGGEHNSVRKDWTGERVKVALAFPDIYDLGMSNLGLMLLYDQINQQEGMLAERVYAPWDDMERVLRENGIPLYTLESFHAVADFDLLGISIPYEQLYTNVLNLLDLAGLPLRSADRDETHPIVIAGGHACYNPEPMAPFIDAFLIGEGEEAIVEIAALCRQMRGIARAQLLRRLARIPGVYVPSLYEVRYHPDGTVAETRPFEPDVPARILKRIVPQLPPPFTRFLVPNIATVHNRASIEIMRGCTRGCRFCHAGMVTRPVRERPVDEIVEAIDAVLDATGYEDISLMSLSSSDYTRVHELVNTIRDRFAAANVSISLPSLRIESASADLLDALGDTRRSGFTFAPEAATEGMRRAINKSIEDEQVLQTARDVFSRGWRTIKFYFMIGHPDETLDDVQAIIDLCKATLAEGQRLIGQKASVNVGISTFIPKPHTPLQWVPQDTSAQIRQKQALLRDGIRGPGIHLRYNHTDSSELEGYLSRGDRRLAAVIERAWALGCRFDAWNDRHQHHLWLQAFAESNLDPAFYAHRQRGLDEVFPWDHIDPGVHKSFLQRDYQMSRDQQTRDDCRDQCYACGILPKFSYLRAQTAADEWECPPVTAAHLRSKADPALAAHVADG